MSISTSQLQTWSKPGQTGQFTASYDALRDVLNDSKSPYHSRNFTIFLQGSYKNVTNVHDDSDVDAVIRLDDAVYSDRERLSPGELTLWDAAYSDATYSLTEFKRDVLSWLTHNYGQNVRPGPKAIFIKGSGGRRDADVLICSKFRRYYSFKDSSDPNFVEGICFFQADGTRDGTRIANFPKQHRDNCTQKHKDTRDWFKPTVRIFKNLRNTMIEKNLIEDDLSPSYFIESLLYNVPNAQFGGTDEQNFLDVLSWLNNADRSKFECANNQYYLFHPTSPVTWRAEQCSKYLHAATNYWANA